MYHMFFSFVLNFAGGKYLIVISRLLIREMDVQINFTAYFLIELMLDTDFRAKAVSIVEFYLVINLIWFLAGYDYVGKSNHSLFAHHFWGINRNLTTKFLITHHICISGKNCFVAFH